MSDYLWDKTGEPEADVEQLENLLGTLKYQPRPLEIPASAMPKVARPATTMFFSRPRLAIAASLILTLLAGTWLVTRQNEPQPDRTPAAVEKGNPAPENKQLQTEVVSNNGTNENTSVNRNDQPPPREDKNVIMHTAAPKPHRVSRQFVARRGKQQPRRVKEETLPQREEIAVTKEEREATEKVMLALRLASAKLNFAQRELQEISRANR